MIGDIVGSTREFNNIKTKDFELFPRESSFTDDTVLSIAVADALINNTSIKKALHDYGNRYTTPQGGYGGRFLNWLNTPIEEASNYDSFGNGSSMRCSVCGWLYDTLEETLEKAKESALPTHNHEEGIKGAQATASAIYLFRNGKTKEEVKKYIEDTFNYNLSRTVDEIRPRYSFKVSCQETVPEAIICVLEGNSFEDVLRNAISLGGDSDTLAAIACSIAEAIYDISEEIKNKALSYLPQEFITIIEAVNTIYYNKVLL